MPTSTHPLPAAAYPAYHVGDVREDWVNQILAQSLTALPLVYRSMLTDDVKQRLRAEIYKALAMFLSRPDVQAEVTYRVVREYDGRAGIIVGATALRTLADARERQP